MHYALRLVTLCALGIAANPGWTLGVIILLGLMFINTFGKNPHLAKATGYVTAIVKFARQLLDLLSLWSHSDSPGTWKPPLLTWVGDGNGIAGSPIALSLSHAPDGPGKPSGAPPAPPAAAVTGLVLCVVLGLAGCTPAMAAAWRTAGIEAALCTAPEVVNAAGDATVALLTDGLSGTPVTTQSLDALGLSLLAQYGVKALTCSLGKLWLNLAGASHRGELRPRAVQVRYLLDNLQRLARPAPTEP